MNLHVQHEGVPGSHNSQKVCCFQVDILSLSGINFSGLKNIRFLIIIFRIYFKDHSGCCLILI